jgi:hypothetical protein
MSNVEPAAVTTQRAVRGAATGGTSPQPPPFTPPPTVTPPPPVVAPAPSQSARRIVENILSEFGLNTPTLVDLVMNEITEDTQINRDRLMTQLRATSEYQQRFAGMRLRREAGLPAITETEYVALERMYAQFMRQAGLPAGFYDSPDDFARFIGADVSAAEFQQRIANGYRAVAEADQTLIDQFRTLFGVTDGELAAYMLDPDRALPLIEEQVATARVGAAAARAGFANVVQRETLTRMAQLGVTEQQASDVFGTIARNQELFQPLDPTETAITVDEAAMGLSGNDAAAARRIRQRQERRRAEFAGAAGGFATQGPTITGLTEAR